MASSLETNKILAALLTAGIFASGAGVVSRILYHPTAPEEPAYLVEVAGAAEEGGGDGGGSDEVSVAALLANADPAGGETGAKKCAACHTFEEGGANKIGPNLWGLLGRDIASVSGFEYSEALTGLEGEWDYDKLDGFLAKPKDYAPGTKMAYVGMKGAEDRADLIMYLRSLAADPLPLPEAEAATEEAAAEGDGAESEAASTAEAPEGAAEETAGVADAAVDAASDAAGAVEDTAEEVAEAASEVVDSSQEGAATATGIVQETAEAAGDAVVDAAEATAEAATEQAADAAEAVSDAASETAEAAGDAVADAAEATAEAVEGVTEQTADAAEAVSSAASETIDAAADAASDAVETAKETAGEATAAVAAAAGATVAAVTEGAEETAEAAGDASGLVALIAAGDVAKGEKVSKKCKACHVFDEGGKNKLGPALWDVVGRDVASHEGFKYSPGLSELGGKWTYETLDEFLAAPKTYVPGTKMVFAGVKKEQDRADLIAYLRSLSSDPKPLAEGG